MYSFRPTEESMWVAENVVASFSAGSEQAIGYLLGIIGDDASNGEKSCVYGISTAFRKIPSAFHGALIEKSKSLGKNDPHKMYVFFECVLSMPLDLDERDYLEAAERIRGFVETGKSDTYLIGKSLRFSNSMKKAYDMEDLEARGPVIELIEEAYETPAVEQNNEQEAAVLDNAVKLVEAYGLLSGVLGADESRKKYACLKTLAKIGGDPLQEARAIIAYKINNTSRGG
ncbi:MAG: hypothetical protein HZB68_00595 [Candidatus Aenigmarchaeota archaeon]|nr:hypothetical protein [Candidatus Aenigmarchaeota archaeon]